MLRLCFLLLLLSTSSVSVLAAEVPSDGSDKLSRTKELLQESQTRGTSALTVQSSRDGESSSSLFGRMLQGLMLCLGVFFIGTSVAKRLRRGQGELSGRKMRILEKLPLTQKSALYYVEINGRSFVVSCGSEQMQFMSAESSESYAERHDYSLATLDQVKEEAVCAGQNYKLSA